MTVWRYNNSTLRPCKCPLCRRPISLIVPSEDTTQDRNDSTVAEVLRNLETYNRLFGGGSISLVQVYICSILALFLLKKVKKKCALLFER